MTVNIRFPVTTVYQDLAEVGEPPVSFIHLIIVGADFLTTGFTEAYHKITPDALLLIHSVTTVTTMLILLIMFRIEQVTRRN